MSQEISLSFMPTLRTRNVALLVFSMGLYRKAVEAEAE